MPSFPTARPFDNKSYDISGFANLRIAIHKICNSSLGDAKQSLIRVQIIAEQGIELITRMLHKLRVRQGNQGYLLATFSLQSAFVAEIKPFSDLTLAEEGSNLQPPDPKSGVLPIELSANLDKKA